MKAKTLLMSAGALAAGVMATWAAVYSQNIVGYVNVVLPAGQNALICNPLDNGTNTANDLLGGLPNKSVLNVWTGAGYTPYTKGASGFSPNPSLPVGTGFFVKATSLYTNTFVGTVVPVAGNSVTNNLPAGVNVLVGSTIPLGGTFNDVGTNAFNLIATLPNKSVVNIWNGSGYTPYTKGASGFSPNPTLNVGQGFFVKSTSATNWVQTLGQ
jgi:hypothetical protein